MKLLKSFTSLSLLLFPYLALGKLNGPNLFLQWAQDYADTLQKSSCWICGLLPLSSSSGLPWWVSPLQGTDWHYLCQYIDDMVFHPNMSIYRDISITKRNVSYWPLVNTSWNSPGHGKPFSYTQTAKIMKEYAKSKIKDKTALWGTVKPNNMRYTDDGYFQVWDEFMWLTPTIGQLNKRALLCWEQRNHTYDAWPNSTRELGWLPSVACTYTIVLQATDWFATDWSRRPNMRWLAPNGTQWLCGTNLWPWLPPGWIGRCTLGFPWMQGSWHKEIPRPANYPNLVSRWTRSVFHWYDHLFGILIPQLGIEDIMWHVEALTKYTTRALNDSMRGLSLINSEVALMRKAVLQNRMALDILTAAQGGTCAIIKAECCVYIPDSSANMSDILADMHAQIEAMSDASGSLNDWISSWSGGGSIWSWVKKFLILAVIVVMLGFFLCCGGYCCCMLCIHLSEKLPERVFFGRRLLPRLKPHTDL
ncbi:endogenous retrovirus group PABLB member 1 Env polyprotein [Suricata suricatta]|uniref:endogenous retrovirus group PABLB member 1 Env polyprotein n=1 Tax=Suricata suricatta TaxID=37032 RepID=UPI001155EDD4|nr:endogenous retrovirus group PABLB member 1 Env polyprotein [Suricata suricatta]